MEQARVYIASVDCLEDPVLYQKVLELLPGRRREDADRMKVADGKRLSAGAGLLLMAALSDCLQDTPAEKRRFDHIEKFHDLRIELGERGKPWLPDYPEVHFNLSHSGSRVMCVVSPKPAGCDLELVKLRNIDMVIRCLAESEQRIAETSPTAFFRIWTLKESVLKLSGKGLQIPLRSFEVSLDPLSVRQDFLKESVLLKEYETFRPEYCCSVALTGVMPPETMTEVDLRAVLDGDTPFLMQ